MINKVKNWQEGVVRLHHWNSKFVLLSDDDIVLAQTFFVMPRSYMTSVLALSRIHDAFVIDEGEEITFHEDGYVVVIGDLVDTSSIVSLIWCNSCTVPSLILAVTEYRSSSNCN